MYITCWLATDGKWTIQFTQFSILTLFTFSSHRVQNEFCRNFKTSFTPMLVVTKMSGTSGCYDNKNHNKVTLFPSIMFF